MSWWLALVACADPVQPPLFVDQDGDGVVAGTDCDDTHPDVGGQVAVYRDADGDGFGDPASEAWRCDGELVGWVRVARDCDDTDPTAFDGATEVCDGADNDCDGRVDADAVDARTVYVDGDGDGYGGSETAFDTCDPPSGSISTGGDCDDDEPAVFPAADELCDGVDQDCDGEVDEEPVDGETYYVDGDLDGYGSVAIQACGETDGVSFAAGDCDDEDTEVSPGRNETCDERDEDCDGLVDEDAAAAPTWYADRDGDGHGDPDETATACEQPWGWTADALDCDDTSGSVNPDAVELCNKIDDDCDGAIDADAADATVWYRDVDGDGYGDDDDTWTVCPTPAGYAEVGGDCDDADASAYPVTWYADADGDGYGDPDATTDSCTAPTAHVAGRGDCDDGAADTYAGADDSCGDGIDQDCDGYDHCTELMTRAYAQVVGGSDHASLGQALAGAGDVDADGELDLLIGDPAAHGEGDDLGVAYLFTGPFEGSIEASEATAAIWGETEDDFVGFALAAVGDLDGDGFDELAVGAAYATTPLAQGGGVGLFAVPISGQLVLSDADTLVPGAVEDAHFGYAIDAGDVDGDGTPDLVSGAPDAGDDEQGGAYVFVDVPSATGTPDAALLIGERTNDDAGRDLAVFDADADGIADVLVGAPYHDENGSASGAAYLVRGPVTADTELADADLQLDGESSGNYLGYSVDGLGDTDGDGYADLALGAYGYDGDYGDLGAAYVLAGPLTGRHDVDDAAWRWIGVEQDDYAGFQVAGPGDLDGDGHADVAVSVFFANTSHGGAYVLLGPVSSSASLAMADGLWSSTESHARAVYVAGPGDLDGNGCDDLLIGATDHGGSDGGGAFLYGAWPP